MEELDKLIESNRNLAQILVLLNVIQYCQEQIKQLQGETR